MGWMVLYIAFAVVALWLLGEVLLQYKARLRWRLLAFVGFLGVVLGVLADSIVVIGLGAAGFAVGQTFVTLSFRRGFSTGWALGGRPGASKRRRTESDDHQSDAPLPPPPGFAPQDGHPAPPPAADPYGHGAPATGTDPAATQAQAGYQDRQSYDYASADGYQDPGYQDQGYDNSGYQDARYEDQGYPEPPPQAPYPGGHPGEAFPVHPAAGDVYLPGHPQDGGYGDPLPGHLPQEREDALAASAHQDFAAFGHAPEYGTPLPPEAPAPPVYQPQPMPDDTGGYAAYSDPGYDDSAYASAQSNGNDVFQGYDPQYQDDAGEAHQAAGYGGYQDPHSDAQLPGSYDSFGGQQSYAQPAGAGYGDYTETPPGGVWVPQQRESDPYGGALPPEQAYPYPEQPPAEGYEQGPAGYPGYEGYEGQQYRY